VFKRLFGRDKATEDERQQVEQGLARTRGGLRGALGALLGAADITEETWDDLEAVLIQSDIGAGAAVAMVEDLREQARHAGVRRADELPRLLRHVMVRQLQRATGSADEDPGAGLVELGAGEDAPKPYVILMVGVNGSGKTTTIAKLARRILDSERSVYLVAADTFRAAAIDQLAAWGERVGAPVMRGTPGGDPGAVVFDALRSAAARQTDVILVDTAGRLHTQKNLMAELEKVQKIVAREMPGAPHETLLVLDATTGQNGLRQAERFTDTAGVSGIVLAKLDSSAKGGVAFSVTRELGLPIRWVGTGEAETDLAPFDATAYVDGLLGGASSAR
jgi:fused signal recognition particle receptor